MASCRPLHESALTVFTASPRPPTQWWPDRRPAWKHRAGRRFMSGVAWPAMSSDGRRRCVGCRPDASTHLPCGPRHVAENPPTGQQAWHRPVSARGQTLLRRSCHARPVVRYSVTAKNGDGPRRMVAGAGDREPSLRRETTKHANTDDRTGTRDAQPHRGSPIDEVTPALFRQVIKVKSCSTRPLLIARANTPDGGAHPRATADPHVAISAQCRRGQLCFCAP